jgi:hypothetical protein
MTKKRYSKTARVSRSARAPRNRYPFERRYARLQGDDPHPVDVLIDKLPQVRALDGKLVRLSRRVRRQIRDVRGYVRYEDLRGAQRTRPEEAYYDCGHERGRVDGVVESLNASIKVNAKAQSFASMVTTAQLMSKLSPEAIVAALLELARGMVLGKVFRLRGRPMNRPHATSRSS